MKRYSKIGAISLLLITAMLLQPLAIIRVNAASIPQAPTGLKAVTPTDQVPSLTWDADSAATYYQINRDGAGIYAANVPWFLDETIRNSGTYVYGVQSCNHDGCSADSTITIIYSNDRPTIYEVIAGGAISTTDTSAYLYAKIVNDDIGLKAAEYFVGADPGPGQGIPLAIKSTNSDPVYQRPYYVSTYYTQPSKAGTYKVGIRAQNNNGAWSTEIRDLVVYDVYGPKVTASRTTITPSLANGDVLPGLTQAGQTNIASFAFTNYYDPITASPSSKTSFTFNYQTGTCGRTPVNCTTFSVSSQGRLGGWLMTDSQNLSRSIFASTVDVTINGITTQKMMRVEAVDGNKRLPIEQDWVSIRMYDANANIYDPNTQSIYHVIGRISGGTIVIQ